MSVRLGLPKEATKVCTGGLSKILREFYASVRTKDEGGEGYQRDNYHVMVIAEYKSSIISDRELKSLKRVLKGKARIRQQKAKARSRSTEQWQEIKIKQKTLIFLFISF